MPVDPHSAEEVHILPLVCDLQGVVEQVFVHLGGERVDGILVELFNLGIDDEVVGSLEHPVDCGSVGKLEEFTLHRLNIRVANRTGGPCGDGRGDCDEELYRTHYIQHRKNSQQITTMAESSICYMQRYGDLLKELCGGDPNNCERKIDEATKHWSSAGRIGNRYYGCDEPRKVWVVQNSSCGKHPPISECINNPECHGAGQQKNKCWDLLKFSQDGTGHIVPGDKYRRWTPVRDPGVVELDVSFTTPDFLGSGDGAAKKWVARIDEVSSNPTFTTTQNIGKKSTPTSFGVKILTLSPRNYTLSLGYKSVGGQMVYPNGWRKGFTVQGTDGVMSPEIIKVKFVGTGTATPQGVKAGYMKSFYLVNSLTNNSSAKTYGDASTCKIMAESGAAKARNVYAWGHRNTSVPTEEWRNTCFFYKPFPGFSNSHERPSGLTGVTYHASQCADPTKNIFLGCRERLTGTFKNIPVDTRLGMGSFIYNSNKSWALQFIQDRGKFMLVSINMSNGTSKMILDYSAHGNLGALAVIRFRQGVELLTGFRLTTIKQRSPTQATVAPSAMASYEFEYDDNGRLQVRFRLRGFINRLVNLATYG